MWTHVNSVFFDWISMSFEWRFTQQQINSTTCILCYYHHWGLFFYFQSKKMMKSECLCEILCIKYWSGFDAENIAVRQRFLWNNLCDFDPFIALWESILVKLITLNSLNKKKNVRKLKFLSFSMKKWFLFKIMHLNGFFSI